MVMKYPPDRFWGLEYSGQMFQVVMGEIALDVVTYCTKCLHYNKKAPKKKPSAAKLIG